MKWDKHFVLHHFFLSSVCIGCGIHLFLSEEQKGHRCIIVSAPVKMPSKVVRIPDAPYKPQSCFYFSLKNDAASWHGNPRIWTTALRNTHWSCLLSQCAGVNFRSLANWFLALWPRGNWVWDWTLGLSRILRQPWLILYISHSQYFRSRGLLTAFVGDLLCTS